MRVNLIIRRSDHSESGSGTIPLSLTICPACGLTGDYEYQTDSAVRCCTCFGKRICLVTSSKVLNKTCVPPSVRGCWSWI